MGTMNDLMLTIQEDLPPGCEVEVMHAPSAFMITHEQSPVVVLLACGHNWAGWEAVTDQAGGDGGSQQGLDDGPGERAGDLDVAEWAGRLAREVWRG